MADAIEQRFTFDKIADLYDVARRHGRLQTCLEPHPRETLSRRNGDGHPAQHAAQGSLGSIEIPMGIDEYHANAQWF